MASISARLWHLDGRRRRAGSSDQLSCARSQPCDQLLIRQNGSLWRSRHRKCHERLQSAGPAGSRPPYDAVLLTLPYFNSHKDEIDAKEKSIGDAKRPAHAFIQSTKACVGHDARSRLGQIKVPTLVNCGTEDTSCSASCSQELAALIPGAKIKLYPNSSHFFLNEHFDQSMADILAFLGSVKVRQARGPEPSPVVALDRTSRKEN